MNEKTVSWQMGIETVQGVMPRTREEMILWSADADDHIPQVVRRERDYVDLELDPYNTAEVQSKKGNFSGYIVELKSTEGEGVYCFILLLLSLFTMVALAVMTLLVYVFIKEKKQYEKNNKK